MGSQKSEADWPLSLGFPLIKHGLHVGIIVSDQTVHCKHFSHLLNSLKVNWRNNWIHPPIQGCWCLRKTVWQFQITLSSYQDVAWMSASFYNILFWKNSSKFLRKLSSCLFITKQTFCKPFGPISEKKLIWLLCFVGLLLIFFSPAFLISLYKPPSLHSLPCILFPA